MPRQCIGGNMEELVFLGDVRHIPYLYGIVKAYTDYNNMVFKHTFKFVFEDAEFCVDDDKRNDGTARVVLHGLCVIRLMRTSLQKHITGCIA